MRDSARIYTVMRSVSLEKHTSDNKQQLQNEYIRERDMFCYLPASDSRIMTSRTHVCSGDGHGLRHIQIITRCVAGYVTTDKVV